MRKKRFQTMGTIVLFLMIVVQSAYPQDNIPAVFDEILDLYKNYDVVLFGEDHDQKRNHDFRLALLRCPKFAETVNDIVIECANSLYQELLDDFILKLKDVSDKDLQKVWRNTTVTSGVWDSPIYEEFIRAVRKVNESLRPEKRIRLIAGDPPIDWEKTNTGKDYIKFRRLRDETAYTVIENEIIKKNRKGFVIYGPLHLITPKELVNAALGLKEEMGQKGYGMPFGATFPHEKDNIASYLKEKYPGKAYSVYPCGQEDFMPPQPSSENGGSRFDQIKKIMGGNDKIPCFLKLAGTAYESLPASKIFDFLSGEPIGQVMDSILFFGSMHDEMVNFGPKADNDIPYQNELKRRREIVKKALEILKMQDKSNAPWD